MALTVQEAQETIDCGIWQGRFQFVHNGHVSVFKSALRGFRERFVAIVNPNPLVPVEDFTRFDKSLNPFNYFKRMLLWKTIADFERQSISIIPCWHARKSVQLENEFLPYHSDDNPGRCWIVPIGQDDNERKKEADLKKLGEIVCDSNFSNEPLDCMACSASLVRQCYDNETWEIFNKCVPNCIQELTKRLARNNDPNEYQIVPIVDDELDFTSLQAAINWVKQADNRYIVVAISVGVENCNQWWYQPARRLNSTSTFYNKSKALRELFGRLYVSKYLITPYFIQENDVGRIYQYSEAFLPSRRNSKWVINGKLNYGYRLKECLQNMNIEDCSSTYVDDLYFKHFSEKDLAYYIKPIRRDRTQLEGDITRLKEEIKSFLSLQIGSSDDLSELFNKFKDTPNDLESLLMKIKYNAISDRDASEIFIKIRKEWVDK
ncbi:MAG: hypothetical protein ACI4MQ_01830 [Candidatus Coproplasma sp.]